MAGLSRLELAAASLLKRRSSAGISRRAYGSAAAAQLDYDDDDEYYYYSDEDEQRREANRAAVNADSAGCVPRRGIHWVLIGDRGAKKHLYAERLSKLLEVPHISMGSLVRQELNPCSSLYKTANAVNEGKMVEDEVIFALLSKRLEEGYYRGENGFILDGIPRSRIQAELMDQIAEIDLVVNLKSTDDNLVKKNLGIESLDLLTRRNALECANAEQSKLLEDYYRKQNKLIDFQVRGAPGETWKGLLAALHLQHMNAVSSYQKLTA